jgi:hypothetical protein
VGGGACWLRTMEGENQEMQRAKGGERCREQNKRRGDDWFLCL